MSNHTQEHWKAARSNPDMPPCGEWDIYAGADDPDDDQAKSICQVFGGLGGLGGMDDDSESDANKDLILAAPAMYRVLSRIAEYDTHGQDRVSLSALMHDGDDTIGQALRNAIAAAEGREVTT